ncbi:MAG TPA: 4Fe-4S dicluster domain-containing protein [Candidatus Limiplasma sp.]|nr:4Fe-4S dicluster domain-containing protein [Candidatus Limiplasma sp.]
MKTKAIYGKGLKVILWTYIILCVIIAGLNYGYAPRADAATARFLTWFWQFYENGIKTGFIIVASILTIKIVKSTGRTTLRVRNMVGFIVSALLVHIVLPLTTGNSEWYFFTMPLPWTTTPLQLLDSTSAFYTSRAPLWGPAGVVGVLIFYGIATVFIFTGTALFGRRLQCSMLCLFNGFAAEVFEPAMPLLGVAHKPSKRQKSILRAARWVFFVTACFFSAWWTASLLGITPTALRAALAKAETYMYLTGDLLMAIFFWVAFSGRGYCYYCPLGTVLSVLAKIGGQRIQTDLAQCIQCGRCTAICPMSIDVRNYAEKKEPVRHSLCVGCGHCVDTCPTKTLLYTTQLLDRINRR